MNRLQNKLFRASVPVLTALGGLLIVGGCSSSSSSNNNTGGVETGSDEALLSAAKLLIEHNATAADTGFQGFADGEPWNSLRVENVDGEQILSVSAEGGFFDFGITELFFETSEPENAEVPIDNVLARLPAGEYAITGAIVDEAEDTRSALLSHAIPAGPQLLTPADGSVVTDIGNVIVSWNSVTQDLSGAALAIAGYQVIVEEDAEPEFLQGFARALFSVHLPSTARQVTLPGTFLDNNACYKYEVLAIEESGNQTLAEGEFETGSGCAQVQQVEDDTPRLTAAKLLIEHNATDEDTGFQGFADGDPWNQLTISTADNQPILMIDLQGGLLNFGLTELFFETSEPENSEVPIADVLARLPAGDYTITADMVDGGVALLSSTLTHTIPAGPILTSPADGADNVDPDNTSVAWQSVNKDINGQDITIVGYQVIVEEDADPEFPQGFARELYSIHLPATATSVAVPREFMISGKSYKYEVLAIEASGNQTLSAAMFSTQ